MHRRLWLLAGAAAVLLVAGATASASTKSRRLGQARRCAFRPVVGERPAGRPPPARRRACSCSVWSRTSSASTPARPTRTPYWAALTGNTPTLRGNYIIDNQGNYHLDLASKVTATKSGLSITIRPDANWNWVGHAKAPVTYKDYVYTWQQIVNKANTPASTTGYDQITSFSHKGTKQITFKWKTPFADYRDLFGLVYPSEALGGPRTGTRSGPTASAVRTAIRFPTARSSSRTTRRARARP